MDAPEPTDSRMSNTNPEYRSLALMSHARLVEYALDRRRELRTLQSRVTEFQAVAQGLQNDLDDSANELGTALARVAELEKDAAQEEERTNNLHLFLSSLPYLNSPISIKQVLDNWKTRNEQYERKAGLLWSRERGLGAMNKEQP